MFKETHKNLGTVKPGQETIIEFEYKDMLILSVVPDCGCSISNHIPGSSIIQVKYTASNIPIHLKKKNVSSLSINKGITVNYTLEGSTESKNTRLSFTATIQE